MPNGDMFDGRDKHHASGDQPPVIGNVPAETAQDDDVRASAAQDDALPADAVTATVDRRIMLLVAGATFMEIMDGTIITTAAPAISRSLHVAPAQISVSITAYVITLAVLIPLSGWLADRWGSKTVFLTAIAVFTTASVLCAASQTLLELTALRVLQAIGGAMMVPVGRLVVLRVTPRDQLVRALATLTWPALTAPIIAPLAGGALTTYLSWRWIFLINLPIGVAALLASWRLLPQVYGESRRPMDVRGFGLTTVSLAALVIVSEAVAENHVDAAFVAITGVTTLAFGALAIRHLLRVADPMLDLRVFSIPTFRLANASGGLYRIAISAMPFLLPLLFQEGFGWSAVRSGAVVLVLFAGNLAIKPLTTPMLRRFGFRAVILGASLVSAATMLLCALLAASTPVVVICVVLVVSGAARSTGFTAYITFTFADVGADLRSAANTVSATVTQLGLGLGVALGAVGVRLGQSAKSGLDISSPIAPYRIAFLLVGAVMLVAALGPALAPKNAGSQLVSR